MAEPKKKSKSKSPTNVSPETREPIASEAPSSPANSETPATTSTQATHAGTQGLTPAQLGRLISGFILIAIGAATFFRFFSRGPQGLSTVGLPVTTTAEWIIGIIMLVIFALIPIGIGCWLIFFNLGHAPSSRPSGRRK